MERQIRSLIFVPAIEKFLAKFKVTDADAVIFDLEDSIPEDDKEKALQLLECFLPTCHISAKTYVRINRDKVSIELPRLAKSPLTGYVVPKFEPSGLMGQIEELRGGREVIALIETPMGLVKLNEIASNNSVTAIAFGAEDYTCTVNMKNDFKTLLYAKSRIVMYASAYNKDAYDTPSFNYKDLKKFEADVEAAGDMGFTGKLAIHPDQVPVINKVFDRYDYDYIENVIEQFDLSNAGVLKIHDFVYEKPHIERLRKIIESRRRK